MQQYESNVKRASTIRNIWLALAANSPTMVSTSKWNREVAARRVDTKPKLVAMHTSVSPFRQI